MQRGKDEVLLPPLVQRHTARRSLVPAALCTLGHAPAPSLRLLRYSVLGAYGKRYDSVHAMLEEYYAPVQGAEAHAQLHAKLAGVVAGAIKKARGKVSEWSSGMPCALTHTCSRCMRVRTAVEAQVRLGVWAGGQWAEMPWCAGRGPTVASLPACSVRDAGTILYISP